MSTRSSRAVRTAALLASIATVASAVASTSCGPGSETTPRTAGRELAPQWQDVFDGAPEIYAVVRPQAIKRDAVYGALFRNVLRVAQARSAMRGVTTLEALEGCDEIILGIRKEAGGLDAAMVLRGVPASLDPQRMTDAAGHHVFRLVDARAKTPEYEWSSGNAAETGAVFVLPDRTWVGTIGAARERARQAFATPFGRQAPKAEPDALATVRLDARTFLQTQRLENSELLGPLTRRLRLVTLSLEAGKGGLVATLRYDSEEASGWAEMHAKRVLDEIRADKESSRPPPPRGAASLEWVKTAQVSRSGSSVVVTLAIPARLLDELPRASGGDLAL